VEQLKKEHWGPDKKKGQPEVCIETYTDEVRVFIGGYFLGSFTRESISVEAWGLLHVPEKGGN